MSALILVLGNKNYSSWSLRPWLVLKHVGVPFEEKVIPLDQPQTGAEIARFSPSGRVPVLLDGETRVWDSLAIAEYLNERFPQAQLWPADATARAAARAVSAEMHSGFTALREAMPMKFNESLHVEQTPPVQKDIQRIKAVWAECRERFGKGGPFLFGAYSIADAMYGPVVSRFQTYGVALDGPAGAYAQHVWKLPAMQEWLAGARAETLRMARYDK
jgi:glutathione S-transferase